MATRNEYDSTRARANLLRQVLEQDIEFDQLQGDEVERAKDVLELCLSCKGCKSECPSNVDMAKIKAQFTHQYFRNQRRPFRQQVFADFGKWAKRGTAIASVINAVAQHSLTSGLLKRVLGIHRNRSLPTIANRSLRAWFNARKSMHRTVETSKTIFLYCDEFTNFIDVNVGKAAIELLELLGYTVLIPEHVESGRSAISFGMLDRAKKLADDNVRLLGTQVTCDRPLIGIEPSAILTFRDEYAALVSPELEPTSRALAANTFTIEEFLASEMEANHIRREQFADGHKPKVLLHLHCHQKALSSSQSTKSILEFAGYQVEQLPSGCCGMAGFFGYDKNKFDLSIQIGELVLFPAIRESDSSIIIAANGTSCRHQIFDETGRAAKHPVEILRSVAVSGRSCE